ncbi:hypothetical protein [Polymorphobacter fuscus]|uniref:Uncharacterized protein n=1 Tax=Sandarakinorhabdus fusca TaxID=1439888 RepID=A0A7C9GP99_9SPHN|nr:hypothetical protein [Polymorphobacter fuscus]KAB7646189.1 hypothetical protein F9290_08960 [Polymorphobacter fuscus]MQT17392.1 hypothetical protein [Polymorphobacter fuscus]NJC10074.1 hypothetical protein [Polymorphobacter fuscus]
MQMITSHVANAIRRRIDELVASDTVDREKPTLIVEACRQTDWASLTFVGALVELDLRLEGGREAVAAAIATLCNRLPDSDIPVAGHFVADIQVVAGADATFAAGDGVVRTLRIEALCIRD